LTIVANSDKEMLDDARSQVAAEAVRAGAEVGIKRDWYDAVNEVGRRSSTANRYQSLFLLAHPVLPGCRVQLAVRRWAIAVQAVRQGDVGRALAAAAAAVGSSE